MLAWKGNLKHRLFRNVETEGIEIPDGLSIFKEKMAQVSRFKGKLPDNVLTHSTRTVAISRNYLGENIPFERMIWIHDIPEIETGDTLITDKLDRISKDNSLELEVAKRLFIRKDLALFERFINAERWLYKEKASTPDPAAILANVFEKVEGNTFYHYHVSRGEDNFFDDAFDFTNNQKEQFEELINQLPDSDYKKVAIDVLNNQIQYIKSLWKQV